MTVAIIHTDRLELVSMAPAFLDAILVGRRAEAEAIAGFKTPASWPDGHDERFLRLRLDQMRKDEGAQQWLIRAMVLRVPERPMIGHIGFHGPPETIGRAELGYTVMSGYRRRGYAVEAARALMDWAAAEHGVARFFLAIAPDNVPSLAMATKLGFGQEGDQMDEEDGLEYVFELVRA